MWTARFWKDAAERAIKTAAQVAAGYLAAVGATDWRAEWDTALIAIGVATLGSVITSVLSSQVGNPADASLVTDKPAGGVGK